MVSVFHILFCSGLIGRSWAMVFISGGYKVKIYDNQPGQAAKAITEIRSAQHLMGNTLTSITTTLYSRTENTQRPCGGQLHSCLVMV